MVTPHPPHSPTFTWEDSTQYLRDTGQLEEAQKTFNYWNPENDSNNIWNGSGDFGDWLNSLPAEATDKWRNYKISCANMVAWNKGKWGPEYTSQLDVRGHSVVWVGGKTSIWSPYEKDQALVVTEWPQGPDWKQIKSGESETHVGWWYGA